MNSPSWEVVADPLALQLRQCRDAWPALGPLQWPSAPRRGRSLISSLRPRIRLDPEPTRSDQSQQWVPPSDCRRPSRHVRQADPDRFARGDAEARSAWEPSNWSRPSVGPSIAMEDPTHSSLTLKLKNLSADTIFRSAR